MAHADPAIESLRAKWPMVDAWQVFRALRSLPDELAEERSAALAEAASLAPGAAATYLMPWMVRAARAIPDEETVHAVAGIGDLIRAGGDPAAGLATLAEAAGTHRQQEVAARALRAAIERGWSIDPIIERLRQTHVEGSDYTRGRVWPVLRLDAIRRRYGEKALSRLAVAREKRSASEFFRPLELLEEALAGAGPQELAWACLGSSPADASEAFAAVVPLLRESLAQPPLVGLALAFFRQAGDVPIDPGALSPALPEIAAHLREPTTARGAAATIAAFLKAGIDPAPIRAAIDAALDHEDRDVRTTLSRALSKWLVGCGVEEQLPAGLSHRRTYATSDTALGEPGLSCRRCGAATLLIYEHHDGGNTWAEHVRERRCPDCGIYFVQIDGY